MMQSRPLLLDRPHGGTAGARGSVFMFFGSLPFMCTTVIVGKLCSTTGRVIVGHNEDSGGRVLHQQFFCPGGRHAPDEFVEGEPGRARVPQAPETLGVYWSNLLQPAPGSSFDQAYFNEAGLVVCSNSGGSSFTGDLSDEEADLRDGGIGFLLRRLVAERAHTAREAVLIAKSLIENYGYWSPARNYTVADKNEAWCINVVKGRRMVAKRVPDDRVMLISNMLAIRSVDFSDKENVIASDDLVDYAIRTGRYIPKIPGDCSDFDFARAYQDDENRRDPAKSCRMRIGWMEIAGVYCADELHYPELMAPKHKMGVEDVKRVLRLTNPKTYAERGDGRADAFHVSAEDISRSHTRESWVAEIADDPLFTVLWRCASYQDTGVYAPWFPMAGAIPAGCQWMDVETAHREQFCERPENLSLDFSRQHWVYAVLGELVNFNRGLFAGVHRERDALEASFAAEAEAVRSQAAALADREAQKRLLGEFTCRKVEEAAEIYRRMLRDLNGVEASISSAELSVSDEKALVSIAVKASADLPLESIDADTICWSLGFTTSKPAVNAPAKPVEIRRRETPEGAEAIFVFRMHDAAQFAFPGLRADTYIRGIADHRRFVAMIPADFTA